MIEALLFDLDGTLIDSERLNAIAYSEAIALFGAKVSLDYVLQSIRGRHWSIFLPEILLEHNVDADPKIIAELKKTIFSEHVGSLEFNLPLINLIDSMKSKLKIGLVTTASRNSVESIDKKHPFLDKFDCIVTGDDVVNRKPDPEAYILAADKLNLCPHECLIFEDSDVGCSSARAFGGFVIRVSGFCHNLEFELIP